MYGPTPEEIAKERARLEIRHFFLTNRGLGSQVFRSSLMVASTYAAPDPQELVIDAIRQHERRDPLCDAIIGPWGQAAFAALGWEFPEWRPVLGIVSAAAQAYCQERDQARTTAALWTVAVLGIAGVIAAAISGGRVKPS